MAKNNSSNVDATEAIVRAGSDYAELELIYATAPVGLALVDTDLQFVRCNQRLADIDGCSIDDHLGRTLREVIPDAADKIEPIYRQTIETGKPSINNEIEAAVPSDPENKRHFLASYHPVEDAAGKVVAVSAVVVDITDLKAAEALYHSVEDSFHAFMDYSPAVIYMKDSRLRHVYGNQTILELLGLTQEQFLGTTSRDLFPAEIAERIERADNMVLSRKTTVELADFPLECNGATKWFKEVKFPIQSPSGEVIIGGIATDISELKRTQQDLNDELKFERLIAQLAAQLAQTNSGQLDGSINTALKALGTCLQSKRAFLGQFLDNDHSLKVTHLWAAEGIEAWPGLFMKDIATLSSWFVDEIQSGRMIHAGPGLVNLPAEADDFRDFLKRGGVNSGVVVPLVVEGQSRGFLGLDTILHPQKFSLPVISRLKIVADMIGLTIARIGTQEALEISLAEIKKLNERFDAENMYLRKEIELDQSCEHIIGSSPVIKGAIKLAEQVAPTDATVLITGETGTGKELIAQAIHSMSERKQCTMVKVNCAALPATLVESELFGREKGAYTGALARQVGRFEVADGSTLFLDEVGELPLETQAKLLRVLNDGAFERLGSTKTLKVNVRIIAASNRDLEEAVREGRFREDLFFRLSVFPIAMPPLRERIEDIPQLVWHFVRHFSEKMGKHIEHISKRNMSALQQYPWPGNVRELRNVVEHGMIISGGSALEIKPLKDTTREITEDQTMEEVERAHLVKILERVNWRVRGTHGAAAQLDLKPTTLEFRMKKLGIERPR